MIFIFKGSLARRKVRREREMKNILYIKVSPDQNL
jgi:hypothetical protein